MLPVLGVLALAACNRGGANTEPGAAPALASYATQRLVVTPTARVRAPDSTYLAQALGGARGVGRALDDAIAARLRELDVARHWFLPADVQRAFERNRTYAADPYQLAVEPIRSGDFEAGKKYGEPLASQLRTMVALQEEARYLVLPIELRVEDARVTLRVALLDPRAADAKWVGTIETDAGVAPARSLTQLAERFVNLFFAP